MLAADRAQLVSLRFDARGGSRWCENLLKTGIPRSVRHPLALPWGGQSGYVDAAGRWHLSSSGPAPRVLAVSDAEREIDGVRYGAVREHWRLRLDGPRLEWTVGQEWLAETELADAFTPGLFFSARAQWGEATVFQLWERGMVQDAFYGNGNMMAPEAAALNSRATREAQGGWSIAKLYSHACPNGDLRVTVSHHLKKGEVLNYASLLAQSPWCDAAGKRTAREGETTGATLVLEPLAAETGAALAIALGEGWERDNALNRRFFDTHANCGIMADTHEWRLGNEPSGYVALMCRYMHAEMLRFGIRREPLGQHCRDPHEVLIDELGRMAGNLVSQGTLGKGFQSATSLDFFPSYLLAMRDTLVLSGDRALGGRLWAGAKRALAQVATMLDEGGDLIFSPRNHGNDYWDWISRDGHIGYLNILTWMALGAAAEVARWLGDEDESRRADRMAEALREKFEAKFWCEERGFYADWIDVGGERHFYLYAGPQVMAIAAGMVPDDRARRVLDAIRRRRRELGPAWETCFSLQTNFYDAEKYSLMYRLNGTDETRFGETMNGGCLISWNYYWIGALARVGRGEEAAAVWRSLLERFAATSLLEGSNYWNHSGQPSRTLTPNHEVAGAEPFLADQGLVAAALPRWLLGILPTFDGISVAPVLPASAYPATVRLLHLGQERTIEIAGSLRFSPPCAAQSAGGNPQRADPHRSVPAPPQGDTGR